MKLNVFDGLVRTAAFVILVSAASVSSGAEPEAKTLNVQGGTVADTQNFNTLAISGTSSTVPPGFGFTEAGTGGNSTYAAGTGSDTDGNTYSFGAAGDRAFGGLRSGSVVPTIGGAYVFNLASDRRVDSVTISYTGEQWRLGATGRTDQLDFQYSTFPTNVNTTTLTTGTYTDVDALDFATPNTTGVGAKDGNATANRASRAATIQGLNIRNGDTFIFRWNDANPAGSDDGLAVDDFSISVTTAVADVPEPTTSLLFGAASAGLLMVRRRSSSLAKCRDLIVRLCGRRIVQLVSLA